MSMSDVPISGKSTQVSLPLWVGVTFLLLGMATLWWRRYRRLPRWTGLLLFVLVHGVLPRTLSLLSRRNGWSGHGPSTWNLLGLPPVGAGAAFAVWGLALHLVESPEGLEWAQVQTFLLRRGPYAVSRNPMYLGELLLWLGWALFHGSVAVFLGFGLWGAAFRFLIVPREERALEARFGAAYRAYAARVPRWLGLPRRQKASEGETSWA